MSLLILYSYLSKITSSLIYSQFDLIPSTLSSEYLDRIKTQVMDWFGNIKKQPLEIVKASDSTLITSHPEDMFNVIHVQVVNYPVLS